MYQYTTHKTELNREQLAALSRTFEALDRPSDLARLLKCDPATLQKLAANPAYQQFYIPKPGGEKRFIQTPQPALKTIQNELNRHLQAAYYGVKPACAHGFILSTAEEAQPRNIYSNAQAHVRSQWFLNIDLKDFFHAVTRRHVFEVFRYSFAFREDLADLLSRLTTFQGRLPMGAPTSPVLSNFVFYMTDASLTELADLHEGHYTRYADDLTFSFPRPPADGFLDFVRHILLANGFMVKEKKLRLQSRLENPEITGLRVGVGNRPVLSKNYLKTLKKEVGIYRWLVSEAVHQRALFPNWLFEQFRKSLAGQVEFAGFVLGKNDRTYQKLESKLRWG